MESDRGRAYWDSQAPRFDEEPDHGLGDPTVKAEWRALLGAHYPVARGTALDLGCGTGTLSALLADEFHRVVGWDFSGEMVRLARLKNSRVSNVEFVQTDAFDPRNSGRFDLMVSRHVLWISPDPGATLVHWRGLLEPGGVLLLVEGAWHTGVGLDPAGLRSLLDRKQWDYRFQDLADNERLWGKKVDDRRYLVQIHG